MGPARNEPDRLRSLQDEAEQLLTDHRADEASVPLRELAGRQPGDARTWLRLAAALLAGNGGAAADAEARDAAERAVALDPSSAIGYRMLSEAALRMGDRDAALDTMRAAVSAAPDSWVTHLDLAAALIERPGGGREAWQLAKRAASIAPERAEPHVLLGDLALRAGDMDKAAAGYADALDRAPGDVMVTRKLAELHHRLDGGPAAALRSGAPAPDPAMAPSDPWAQSATPDAFPASEAWPADTAMQQSGTAHAAGATPPRGAPEPDETTGRRPVRVLANCVSVLSILAAAVAGMLLALAPAPLTGWYRVVAGVAGAALVVVAVLLLAGSAPGWRQTAGGTRFALVVGTGCAVLAALSAPLDALAGSSPALIGTAGVGVFGCLVAHLVARAVVREERRRARPTGRHNRAG
ncbi:tetratricopeptide repeat protein [Actinocatenispora thailandica]|uniref:tetratricopeptide repeat protein n=1 Tax=Actinocatenispora thailandica TaxID=227318 RepID=UPI00194F5E45|nr:tetratricopeptide repeat protein [Actinocatenispora thailandica]